MQLAEPCVIFLMGPTASGKTDLAIALHDALPCRLISVDSVMVYRGMDIGSAKPEPEVLARAPHALIDIRDPAVPYSAAEFREDALACIQSALDAGELPVLVGGTAMYFKALAQGISDLPPADERVRAAIEAEAAERGWPALHAELASVDPVAAAGMHPNNRQRIQRALEVYRLTGRPLSAFWADQAGQAGGPAWKQDATPGLPWPVLNLAIAPADRAALHARIAQRFDLMLAAGFEDEVRRLHARGDLHADLPSVRAVGYRQMWDYVSGLTTLEAAREKGIAATRQLARRQLTWLRRWPDVHWLDTDDGTEKNYYRVIEILRQTGKIV
ncbi:tRNA (adenosine(37)-N6)-dimethylallyltransferase MiaA [Hahella sp. SMD15-11]|uniref:tRNA dimethylallyltransferase n=1 Tax=Thermohahella caldifontis TaxID=3142973 RepID=A0AB39V0L4_9GAMM